MNLEILWFCDFIVFFCNLLTGKMAQSVLPLLLFSFNDGTAGISTLSSIYKPSLPSEESKIQEEVNEWIANETEIMIKYVIKLSILVEYVGH